MWGPTALSFIETAWSKVPRKRWAIQDKRKKEKKRMGLVILTILKKQRIWRDLLGPKSNLAKKGTAFT